MSKETSSIFSGQTVKIQFLVKDGDGRILNDLSTATTKTITLKSPSGVKVTVDMSLSTDGTDGLIEYITDPTDIVEPGSWKIQGEVTYGTLVYPTSIVYLPVKARI